MGNIIYLHFLWSAYKYSISPSFHTWHYNYININININVSGVNINVPLLINC